MSIRIFLVDDHASFRSCLGDILAGQPGLVVVGSAESAAQALQRLQADDGGERAEVVVLDLEMPGLRGPEAAAALRAAAPELRILVLSSHDDAPFVAAMLAAGAHGYASKDDALPELLRAIREVAAGRRHLSPGAAEALRLCGLQSPHLAD